jgi:uncharacterized protein (TIGR01370 family)
MARWGWFVSFLLVAGCASAEQLSMAVFYGSNPPWDELQAFDIAVVEPQHVPVAKLKEVKKTELFAYVSVGEVDKHRSYLSLIPDTWRLGKNTNWDSIVIDQSQADWPAFFAERVIQPLWEAGFRGFFLDTLDSYQLFAKTDVQRARQEAGLIAVVHELRKRFPSIKLIFNRGFEILPQVHDDVFAVAIESLFQGWNAAQQRYQDVGENDRKWLMGQIQSIQSNYHLPILIIDYVAPNQRELARKTANRIRELGLIPWVSNSALDMLGVGEIEVMPRKVLFIQNGANNEFELFDTYAARYGTMPLNYLGYSVEYQDARQPLPGDVLAGRYAGIVVWLDKKPEAEATALVAWLKQQISSGVPLLVLGEMSFMLTEERAKSFGLSPLGDNIRSTHLRIKQRDAIATFEAEPLLDRTAFSPLHADNGHSLLTIENERHDTQEAISLTPWGGYAISPQPLVFLPQIQGAGNTETNARWVINPIEFMRRALKLPDMPVPDVTTESGRRMLMVHMDGDGFSSRAEFAGSPYAAQVMLERIFKKFTIPTTVSIVQAEIAENGLAADDYQSLEKIARNIFSLPNVEIASHSYSHPFSWQQNSLRKKSWDQNKVGIDDSEGWYRMLIPGYDFTLSNEINGSISYIQSNLAPSNKQVRVFLWTGNANPGVDALEIADKSDLLAMNGGDTLITRSSPSLSLVAPMGIQKRNFFQVYAPNQNENIYTNDWTGPYYGFERVIETFQLTELPYRLKPMDVYFHAYSASKEASLKALDKVLTWSLHQENTPVYVSEYIGKVKDFNHLVVARSPDGWRIRGANQLRQLRIPARLGMPDLQESSGIAGFNQHADSIYLHLAQSASFIRLNQMQPTMPYLVSANARIDGMVRDRNTVTFNLRGHVPVEFSLAMEPGCVVTANGRSLNAVSKQGRVSQFAVNTHALEDLRITCR